MGVGAAGEELRRGLKTRTRTSAKIMSKRRKMHFRLPVFFWYLSSTGTRNRKGDEGEKRSINQTLIAISNTRQHPPSGDFKLLYRLVHVDGRLLDVVFDAVKECALVYDE
jgi:hypothetical protein